MCKASYMTINFNLFGGRFILFIQFIYLMVSFKWIDFVFQLLETCLSDSVHRVGL